MISFLSVFPPYRGGIAKFSDYLYRSLKERVPVEAYNFSKLYPNLLFPGSSQEVEFKVDEYAEPVLHSYNPLNWRGAADRILADSPDTVLYSYWHPFFMPAFYRTLKRIKDQRPQTRIVAVAHNILPHEPFPFGVMLTKMLFGLTDKVVLLSAQTEIEFRALRPESSFKRLFHPVYEQKLPTQSREELREHYGFEKEDHVLLFFGLIRKYKGLDLLIEALNRMDLERLHIRPLIVGEFYTNKQALLQQINPSHMDQYKVVDRFVSEREAAEFLSLSDLMVLPYRTASQSGVLSNAINFGLPVLVSNLPGLREHIKPGENGLVFETNSARSLRGEILHFVEDDLHERMSANIAGLKETLSWERFTCSLLEILEN